MRGVGNSRTTLPIRQERRTHNNAFFQHTGKILLGRDELPSGRVALQNLYMILRSSVRDVSFMVLLKRTSATCAFFGADCMLS
jgi:hypothetical protein